MCRSLQVHIRVGWSVLLLKSILLATYPRGYYHAFFWSMGSLTTAIQFIYKVMIDVPVFGFVRPYGDHNVA